MTARLVTLHRGPHGFPECPCKDHGCTIHYEYDIARLARVYQHGDNPEAVLIVDDEHAAEDEGFTVRAFQAWSRAVHRWLDRPLQDIRE